MQTGVAWNCWLCEDMSYVAGGGMPPVGRTKKTWQNTVSAEMRLLKVDPRDIQDRMKWMHSVMLQLLHEHYVVLNCSL